MLYKSLVSILMTFGVVLFLGGCGQQKASEKGDYSEHSMHEQTGSGSHEGVKMQGKELMPQKTCPVMGNQINRSLFVDFQGKRIYVCCQACIDEVKKDPQKYLDKLAGMGETAEIVPSPDEKK